MFKLVIWGERAYYGEIRKTRWYAVGWGYLILVVIVFFIGRSILYYFVIKCAGSGSI